MIDANHVDFKLLEQLELLAVAVTRSEEVFEVFKVSEEPELLQLVVKPVQAVR